jgi:hypothetical protein
MRTQPPGATDDRPRRLPPALIRYAMGGYTLDGLANGEWRKAD